MQRKFKDISYQIDKIKDLKDSQIYKINIEIPMYYGWIEDVKFIVESSNTKKEFKIKHIKNEKEMVYFESEIELQTKAIYNYYFSFTANNSLIFLKKDSNTSKDDLWQLSVNFDVPNWAKGKIMYHIFVDRFNKKDNKMSEMQRRIVHKSWDEEMIIGPNKEGLWNIDFYGGNLKGIEDKLDYLKSLGVSIIYLSPIVFSQSNHRYDTSDYEIVDPYIGNNSDLKQLCEKAHTYGMKIILDAVFNHTGNDSKYFNEYGTFKTLGAFQSEDSPYYSFYKHNNYNKENKFEYWWGMKNLPVCDGTSKDWQNYIYGEDGIIDKWFSLGIDGLRLDVADELTDEFIEGIRKAVKRNKPDGFILGEVWKNPMRMNRSYIESGKGMDSVMNYIFIDALIKYFKYSDTETLKEVINQIINEYPAETIKTLMNFTSTHDISRAINIFASDEFQRYGEWAWDLNNNNLEWAKEYKISKKDYEKAKEIYKSYIFTLTFFPGILSIFYGDEVGVQGMGNLSNRKPYPWNSIDEDLLEFFIQIGQIRNKETFLEEADLKILDINRNYFAFERKKENEQAMIAINRTNSNINILIPDNYNSFDTLYTLNDSNQNIIKPHGGLVLKKTKK